MYVGIAFISTAKPIQQAGLYGSIIGFVYTIVQTIFSVYLMLKSRNRFKNLKKPIVDIGDLAMVTYGPAMCVFLQIILVLLNGLILSAYNMFLGFTTDQLMCKSFKVMKCHNNNLYAAIYLVLLFPIYCLRSLNNIGYFSIVALVFTFLAIVLILYTNIRIINMSPEEV